jgi:hypothetical protein
LTVIYFDQLEKTSQLVAHLENAREESIQKKLRDAAEHRRQSLTKYDEMAKTASPGKNVGLHLQTSIEENKKLVRQSTLPGSAPSLDYMQEGIKTRLSEAKERQSKILSSFEERAKAPKLGETKQHSTQSSVESEKKSHPKSGQTKSASKASTEESPKAPSK